jgi:hypothetical protein
MQSHGQFKRMSPQLISISFILSQLLEEIGPIAARLSPNDVTAYGPMG